MKLDGINSDLYSVFWRWSLGPRAILTWCWWWGGWWASWWTLSWPRWSSGGRRSSSYVSNQATNLYSVFWRWSLGPRAILTWCWWWGGWWASWGFLQGLLQGFLLSLLFKYFYNKYFYSLEHSTSDLAASWIFLNWRFVFGPCCSNISIIKTSNDLVIWWCRRHHQMIEWGPKARTRSPPQELEWSERSELKF